jgi:hypothetical protein
MQNIKTLRVSENRIPRGKFECKIEGETGRWRQQHNEELHDQYLHLTRHYWGEQIKDEMEKACSTYGRENAKMHMGFLAHQPKGNRPL